MKHTPGEWRFYDIGPKESEYCEVFGPSASKGGDRIQVMGRADAHLIAAAPELLEACKKAAEMIDDDKHPYDMKEMLNKAISKAEGGTE